MVDLLAGLVGQGLSDLLWIRGCQVSVAGDGLASVSKWWLSQAAAGDVGQNPERPSIRVESGVSVLEHPVLHAFQERGWQPKAKRTPLLFGSAQRRITRSADRSLRPVAAFPATELVE
jgi:hypothetical protein